MRAQLLPQCCCIRLQDKLQITTVHLVTIQTHHCGLQSRNYKFGILGHADSHHWHAGHVNDALWTRTVRALAPSPRDRRVSSSSSASSSHSSVSLALLWPREHRALPGSSSTPLRA